MIGLRTRLELERIAMPLVHSKSKKAFEQNVKREIAAGKPPKQALAISYSVQRRAAAGGRRSKSR